MSFIRSRAMVALGAMVVLFAAIGGMAVAQTSDPVRVMLATGFDFPDALAAASTGNPVLLVTESSVPPATSAELVALGPDEVYLVGGTGVISAAVETAVAGLLPSATITRLAGADRFETAAAVSDAAISASGMGGAVGPAGPAGPAGPTGATGAAGMDGADGADGDPGVITVYTNTLGVQTMNAGAGTRMTDALGCDAGTSECITEASCNVGDVAVSGEYLIVDGGGAPRQNVTVTLNEALDLDTWEFEVFNGQTVAMDVTLSVRCLDITP